MYCEKCGSAIDRDALFCEVCGNKVLSDDKNNTNGDCKETDDSACIDNIELHEPAKKHTVERITLTSTREANMSIIHHRITSVIEFGEDRLYINTKPDKFNKVPVVFYQDIVSVKMDKKWFPFNILIIILLTVASFFATGMNPFIALAVLGGLTFLYKNTKITIFLRSGARVELYDSNKSCAVAFTDKLSEFISLR